MAKLFIAALIASAAAVDFQVYDQLNCEPSAELYTTSLKSASSWMNLCHENVLSVKVPPGSSVAIYNQCRDAHRINDAAPNLFAHFEAVENWECLNFITDDGSAPDRVSLQLTEGFEEVCFEHAEHAYQFCPYGDCTVECDEALEAGLAIQDQCQGVDMSQFVWDHPFAMEKKAVSVPSTNPLTAVKQVAGGSRPNRPHHSGQVQGGQPTQGEATQGDAVQGDATQGDATQGDATQGDATQGDATQGDATQGDATQGDATQGDATQGDATQGDATQGDATQGDTTQGDATQGDDPSTHDESHLCYKRYMHNLVNQFNDECELDAEHMISWFFLLSSTVLLSTASVLLCCVWKRRTVAVRSSSSPAVPVVVSAPAVPTTETVVLAELPSNLVVSKVYPVAEPDRSAQEQVDRDYAYALKLAESQ